jgi:Tol biopolymer transport system component
MMKTVRVTGIFLTILVAFIATGLCGCTREMPQPTAMPMVPKEERWGIYALDLDTFETRLIYSSPDRLTTLRLNSIGDRLVFSKQVGGTTYEHEEIFTIGIDGQDIRQLTNNDLWDIYPAWSPDGTQIAFLSMGDSNLDIYIMNADGTQRKMLYDSGFHDADIHWSDDQIVFTSQSQIWIMKVDGTDARQLTDPPRAGE